MACEVECSCEGEAFGHAHACDEDCTWAEARAAMWAAFVADAVPCGGLGADELGDGIAEKEEGGGEGKEEDGEED